jgi:hypothetical protein
MNFLEGNARYVAWPKVCMPMPLGGLGVVNLDFFFARALIIRWIWFSWSDEDKPWKGMQLPVDDCDKALYNAATNVQLGNGRKASF